MVGIEGGIRVAKFKVKDVRDYAYLNQSKAFKDLQSKRDGCKEGARSHESICKELNHIYKAKNADYGNSFSESYQEWGITSAVVRMDDKMRRLKQLAKHDAQVKDERMEDTLLDLANYAIMTLGELRKEKNND